MSSPLDRFTLLETFVRIADAGSISGAARDLGISQPSASRQLAELESRLNTQLMRRTTHSLALTDAGGDLLRDAREILDCWEALEEKHLAHETEIRGKLKIVAPVALGQTHLIGIACDFQASYPDVSLSWVLEDHSIRFAEVGCDCWIKVGPVPDETLVVRRIASVERLLVASASLARQYNPRSPKAASKLPLAALDPFEGSRVPLEGPGNRRTSIAPELRLRTNNIVALKKAAVAGIGMAVMPRWFVANELKTGRLIDLLPNWRAPRLDVNVAYLPGRHQTKRLRLFLETLERRLPAIAGLDKPSERQ